MHIPQRVVWMLMAVGLAAPFGIELMQIGVIQRRLMLQLGYTHDGDHYTRAFGTPFDSLL
jgi:hypothetical protein